MKHKKEVIDTLLELNKKIIIHKLNGNKLRMRFYQSLMSWIVSKQFKNYEHSN
jgi:hypothetical protein